jgi:hypothetical protein
MQNRTVTIASILALAFAAPALAAQTNSDTLSPAQKAADQNFGKVSQDGASAFRNVRLARLAIFDGKTGDAQKDIKAAAASLQRASTDDSVFMKAEAELKAPKGMTQPATATSGKVKWLPIDGALAIGEDYAATSAKAAGVAKANAQLKSGDQAHALETLKLAGLDVSFDEAVAPLQKSIDGVNQAEQLADSGKYYEANQALKGVQDGIRFDEQDMVAVPAAAHNSKMTASSSAKASD